MESEDGRSNNNADGSKPACIGIEAIGVGVHFQLEVEICVEHLVELSVDFVGSGTIGTISDGLQKLLDGLIID